MFVILQTNHVEDRFGVVADVGHVAFVDQRYCPRRQQSFRLQLLTAQADHHHLAAKVRIEANVAQRADWNDGVGRVDGNTAAISVVQPDDVVDVGELRQQFCLDALHGEVSHAGHALHSLGDRQDVARADRAVQVLVALEGVALERWLRLGLDGGNR